MKKFLRVFLIFGSEVLLAIIVIGFVFFILQQEDKIGPIAQNNTLEIVAENLNIPWEIEFMPNNELLVTERTGNLLIITQTQKAIPIEDVVHRGEGGLLGLALHPDFTKNGWVYLYLTSEKEGKTENRIERYYLNRKKHLLEDKKVILSGIPGAAFHDGGRINFGPDKHLYITTGDASNPSLSQNTNSLAGKLLRIKEDGSIPAENPFGNEVYSYGHRNSQGITWDEDGRLWATEHGRSGLQSGFDELNLIEKGKNYGWPVIQGDEKKEGMENPILHSGSSTTWAPASAISLKGNIFFVGLRGEALYQYNIQEKKLSEHFKNQFGRLRAIKYYKEFIYIATSNTDGRGIAHQHDDKIIKMPITMLFP